MLHESLFVSDRVHERTVKLPDGAEHALHFKELPASEFRRFHLAETANDEEKKIASMAMLIASSLCEPDGKPAITVKKAMQLTASAANAIVEAVLEVNGFGKAGKE